MLTFYYGTMNSSKSAQALMLRFNYLQKGLNVLLIKPAIDTRFAEGKTKIVSRIGLSADCVVFNQTADLEKLFNKYEHIEKFDVLIIDECQFCTKIQIEQLKNLSKNLTILCFGLLINFKSELFEASKRLVELADELIEIKSVCKCGNKATINARIVNGEIVTNGEEFQIGAEESYETMCYWCYKKRLEDQNANP